MSLFTLDPWQHSRCYLEFYQLEGRPGLAGLEWAINYSVLALTECNNWLAKTIQLAPPNHKGTRNCSPTMWPEIKRTGKIWPTALMTLLIVCIKLPPSFMLASIWKEWKPQVMSNNASNYHDHVSDSHFLSELLFSTPILLKKYKPISSLVSLNISLKFPLTLGISFAAAGKYRFRLKSLFLLLKCYDCIVELLNCNSYGIQLVIYKMLLTHFKNML